MCRADVAASRQDCLRGLPMHVCCVVFPIRHRLPGFTRFFWIGSGRRPGYLPCEGHVKFRDIGEGMCGHGLHRD